MGTFEVRIHLICEIWKRSRASKRSRKDSSLLIMTTDRLSRSGYILAVVQRRICIGDSVLWLGARISCNLSTSPICPTRSEDLCMRTGKVRSKPRRPISWLICSTNSDGRNTHYATASANATFSDAVGARFFYAKRQVKFLKHVCLQHCCPQSNTQS